MTMTKMMTTKTSVVPEICSQVVRSQDLQFRILRSALQTPIDWSMTS